VVDAEQSNADQLAFWNGPGGETWVARRAHTDAILRPVTEALLARAAPRAGERVLDVGCGCGTSTLDFARAVGPTGSVLALDISGPMLAEAAARARAAGITNITWRQADAATSAVGDYDLLTSNLGLMFFGDPVAALTRLRGGARRGARMVFVCWRPLAENPWIDVPMRAVARHLPPRPAGEPGAPGMFAFADPQRVVGLLAAAGWEPTQVEQLDCELDIAAGQGLDAAVAQATRIGAVSSWLRGQPAELVESAVASVRSALEPHAEGASVRLPGAAWIVRSAPR
jgi:SAM-dependent methyltransferase